MQSPVLKFITILLIAAALFCTGAAAADDEAEYVPGQLFVRFADGTVPDQDLILKDFSDIVSGLYLLKTDEDVTTVVSAYASTAGVIYAEADRVVTAQAVPNDPKYADGSLWSLTNAQAQGAWDITTGSDEVIIAVIDSGIKYDHEDLKDNMWINTNEIPNNGIDDDGNGYVDDYYGYNFIDETSDPMDDNGHGTHCAGTIGAVGNNGIGVTGMNWNTRLMALKVLGSNIGGNSSAILEALAYAYKNGAKIASMSLGGGYGRAENDVIRELSDDILIVAAAGNESTDNDKIPVFPSSYTAKNVLSVAAIDKNNTLADFSDWGLSSVDVASPGVGIMSTTFDGGYGLMSGTSMATPLVSGIAGLMLSANSNLKPYQIIGIIKETADPVEALEGKIATGAKVNATAAVNTAFEKLFYDVTFDSCGGSEIYPEIALKNKAVEQPPDDPVRSGYIFDGWYTEAGEEGSLWDFSDAVCRDMTLYAHWKEKPAAPQHKDHDSITWEKWESADSLPAKSGSYYLTSDVSLNKPWVVSGTVNLCLNGQTISANPSAFSDSFLIQVPENAVLAVYDCGGTGLISGESINGRIPVYMDEEPVLLTGSSVLSAEPAKYQSVSGISVLGTCTLFGGTLCDFSGDYGGAVQIINGGSFVLDGATITRCNAIAGSAVCADNAKSVEIKKGTISNSSASMGAVAVVASPFTMEGGSISNCTAEQSGGAILVYTGANASVTGGIISGCSAKSGGGAIYVNGSTLTLGGDTVITDCSAGSYTGGNGGGIWCTNDASVTVGGSVQINGCSANVFGGGIYCDGGCVRVQDKAAVSGCDANSTGACAAIVSPGTLILQDNAELRGTPGASVKALYLNGECSLFGNTSVDSTFADAGGVFHASADFNGTIKDIGISTAKTNPLLVVCESPAKEMKKRFALDSGAASVLTLTCGESTLYLVQTSPEVKPESSVTAEKSGDTTTLTIPEGVTAYVPEANPYQLVIKDRSLTIGVEMEEEITQPVGTQVSGKVCQVIGDYPGIFADGVHRSGTPEYITITAEIAEKEFPEDSMFPAVTAAFDNSVADSIKKKYKDAVPFAMLSGMADEDITGVGIGFTLPDEYVIPDGYKITGFHVGDDVTECVPKVLEGKYILQGDGFSSYVLALTPVPRSSGGSEDTGSGHYSEYPRTADGSGGVISFGTSPKVKSVTLPAGVKGEVTLKVKTDETGPEDADVALVFEIDIPNYQDGLSAEVNFELTCAEIENAGYTPADVVLMHKEKDGTWKQLATSYEAGTSRVKYTAVTTSFSPFAVVYVKGAAVPVSGAKAEVTAPVTEELYSQDTVIVRIDESQISTADLPSRYQYRSLGGLGLYSAAVPDGVSVHEAVAELSAVNGVMYAELDGVVKAAEEDETPVATATAAASAAAAAKETGAPASPVPLAGIAAGLGAYILLRRR